ncbi:MAG: cadmium-translocating P-type ATPase [Brachyspira sp.]|nr:cadmium-translocating P-type ATPase [Brachyspira sp.]
MCEHHHEHEDENKKSPLLRIGLAIAVFLCGTFLPVEGVVKFAVFFVAYLIAGGDILLKAFRNIIKGEVFDENFLMSIATLGAFSIKEFPEAVMVMILYQVGEYFQDKAVDKSRKSISTLMDIRPDYANIEQNGELVKKSPDAVNVGDVIVVKTGEKIPLDGVVVDGSAVVDTSALSGESLPRSLKVGDNAISGCINTNGVIKIKVSKKFEESTVSKILELVENASKNKSKAENFITKFAKIYTPAVVLGAVLLVVIPLMFGGVFSVWFQRALTFLVISCPCAIVISVPLGFFAGIGGASRVGILVKGSAYVEALSRPYAVVFDKTGTLTKGSFVVTEFDSVGISKEELIEISAKAEAYSNHPIALSIKKAYGKPIDNHEISDVEEIAGNGVKVLLNGEEILVGNLKLMEKFGVTCNVSNAVGTVVYVAKNRMFVGYIVISDELKDDSAEGVKVLKKLCDKVVMLSGDGFSAVQNVAQKLGIEDFYAQLLPENKVEKLEEIIVEKPRKKSVIFVGDGINDAPVLMRADIGIAMGGLGSDAAIEAADVVIMDDKISKVSLAIKLSKRTMTIVFQNIIFALGVKALFLICGALGFVTMWGAVFADVGVTLIAVLNSLRALQTKNND